MDIQGKRAVITGGGSGIGRGIVLALADRGISGLVIADIERDAAERVAEELRGLPLAVHATTCDVAVESSVQALADFSYNALGSVELLFNNAGVIMPRTPSFEVAETDLQWVFAVNLLGVIHGCKAFGPRMLDSSAKSWICNTASRNALGVPVAQGSTYVASKHAVLGYTDALRLEYGDRLGFSVLCPGTVNTGVWNATRNRPASFGGAGQGSAKDHEFIVSLGIDSEFVGQFTVEQIEREEFFIVTHPADIQLVRDRHDEAVAAVQRQWPDGPQPMHSRS